MLRLKQISTFILGGLLILGCGKSSEENSSASSGQEKELVFWHWWTDRQPLFLKFAKEYHKNTGVRIRFQVAAPVGSEYYSKLQAAAQANTLPDIIGIAGGGEFLARYINGGKILELTDAMDKNWREQFFPRALQDFSYKPGNQYQVKPRSVWAVPISATTIQIFYNKDVFKKAGLDPEKPPTTWKSFIEAGKKLRKSGTIPLSIGFGDIWMIGAFLEPYAWSFIGEENLKKTLLGKRPYTSKEWEKVLQLFVDLKKHDLLARGSVTAPNKESEQLFASGRCGMIMNGSWGVSVFKAMNSKLNYGVMKLPRVEGAPYPMLVRGGVGSGAAITSNSKYKKEAIDFFRWLTAKNQQVAYSNEGLDLPANQKSLPELLPSLRPFAEGMNHLLPDIGMSETYKVQETLWKGVQSIFIGEKNVKEVLEDVQKAKLRNLKGA